MNKAELVEQVAQATDMSKADATRTLDATLDAISGALVAGADVSIAGFGKFSVSERGERQGRNPSTGETIMIAASKTAKFSPAKAFKDTLN